MPSFIRFLYLCGYAYDSIAVYYSFIQHNTIFYFNNNKNVNQNTIVGSLKRLHLLKTGKTVGETEKLYIFGALRWVRMKIGVLSIIIYE